MTGTAVSGRVDPGAIAAELQEARARTFLLVAPLSDEDLHLQHDPLMSPIIWDLGHIAHFESFGSPRTSTDRSSSSRCRGCTTPSSILAAPGASWPCPESPIVGR